MSLSASALVIVKGFSTTTDHLISYLDRNYILWESWAKRTMLPC